MDYTQIVPLLRTPLYNVYGFWKKKWLKHVTEHLKINNTTVTIRIKFAKSNMELQMVAWTSTNAD